MSERKTYTIADKTFYHEALTFGQEIWMRDHVFDGKPAPVMTNSQWIAVLQEHAMTICAIVLIEEGQTQASKWSNGWTEVEKFRDWLTANVRPREVMEYIHDFFDLNVGNLWLLADPIPNEIGLPTVSSY